MSATAEHGCSHIGLSGQDRRVPADLYRHVFMLCREVIQRPVQNCFDESLFRLPHTCHMYQDKAVIQDFPEDRLILFDHALVHPDVGIPDYLFIISLCHLKTQAP